MRDDVTWRYAATEIGSGQWVIEAVGSTGTRLRLTEDGGWSGSAHAMPSARFCTRAEAEALLAPWTVWEEEVMLADMWAEIDGERPAGCGSRSSGAARPSAGS